MSRRGDNIFKRKDGRWEARYPCGTNALGKKRYRSVYAKTYTEVKDKRDAIVKSLSLPHSTSNLYNPDLQSITKLWLEWKHIKIKEQTYVKYKYCINTHIIPEIGHYRLSELNANIVNSFLFKKANEGRVDGTGGLSNNYIRLLSTLLNSIIAYSTNEGYMLPLKGEIHKPKAAKKQGMILKREDQEKLEEYLCRNLVGTNLAIYLSLHTGIRIGELCALQWEDIDFTEKILSIDKSIVRINSDNGAELRIGGTKTSSSTRFIPITDNLSSVLLHAKEKSESVFVIATPREYSFVNPRTLENRFKAVLNICGIDKINFHALRHTFATRCIECGVDIKSLSEILGHSSVNITMDIYVHPNIEMKRMAINKLEAVFGH